MTKVRVQDVTKELSASTGKASGRGAYICPRPECLKKAQKSHALERALDAKIDEAVFSQLEAQMQPEGEG